MGLGGPAVAIVVSSFGTAFTLQVASCRRPLQFPAFGVASPKCNSSRGAILRGGLQPLRRPHCPPSAFARVRHLPRPPRRGHDDYLRSAPVIRRLLELLFPAMGVASFKTELTPAADTDCVEGCLYDFLGEPIFRIDG
ncbi:uncharacterized protein LOC144115535 isoform X1 [Amblyomma americanum]